MFGVVSTTAARALSGRAELPPRKAVTVRLRDPRSGETLDHGLVLLFKGKCSYTGEDLAEFHVHGGRAVVAVPNARSPVTQWRHRVYWPLLATLRGTPRPDRRPAPARRFARAVADAGLAIETVAYAAGSVVPPPLDRAFPHTTLRLAAWAERRGPFLLSLLTNQRLVLARKTADPRPGDAAPPGSRFP